VRTAGPYSVRALPEPREELAQAGEPPGGAREKPGERSEFLATLVAATSHVCSDLGDAALEPPPLRFECERARIALGEGLLESCE
jgi:hypothetical protein